MSGSADVRMWKWGYAGKLRMALRHWVCTTRNVHFGVHFANSKWGYAGNLRVALPTWVCTTRTSGLGCISEQKIPACDKSNSRSWDAKSRISESADFQVTSDCASDTSEPSPVHVLPEF